MHVIRFNDVWEMYRLKFVIDGKTSLENFWALRGVTFEVTSGETIGLIGENGAGKSTILKIIMGMIRPDRGSIEVKGRISGLIELGAGFQPELTGIENICLNAGLFGLSQEQLAKKLPDIISFAEIGKFIYAPVKYYSQGMFVRLAFSTAIHIDPDILLIDDTLAVGDAYFQGKCIKKIFELKDHAKTILLVSHDLHLLSRLCKRALLIKEGKIVKVGSAGAVVSLYTQSIGAKENVSMLERGVLSVVFNSGRMLINYRERLLTPSQGITVSFPFLNKMYTSDKAEWKVSKEGEDKITAIGKFYDLPLEIVWNVEINGNAHVKLNISLIVPGPAEIKEVLTHYLFIDDYDQWLTATEEGDFPVINYGENDLRPLLARDSHRTCIGLKGQLHAEAYVPALVIEQDSNGIEGLTQIFNSDFLRHCRIVQYKTIVDKIAQSGATRISFFSGKLLFDVNDIAGYISSIPDEYILVRGKIKLIFESGRLALYYGTRCLTKQTHMGTSFYLNEKLFSSYLGIWKFTKGGGIRMSASCSWPGVPIVECWEIEIADDDSFSWDVVWKVTEEVDIDEQYLSLMCSNEFVTWFNQHGNGSFPADFEDITVDMVQRCIYSGAFGLSDTQGVLPDIVLQLSGERQSFAKILNSDFHDRARIVRIHRVQPEQFRHFLPGDYQRLSVKVSLRGKMPMSHAHNNSLVKEKLKFSFESGKGRIFWDDIELTKRIGLYTSLRHKGRWFDSSLCDWNVESAEEDTIRACGKWRNLPVTQLWMIRMMSSGKIDFCVTMEVLEDIEVERMQANLMLREQYASWLTENGSFPFPPFQREIDDDWDSVFKDNNARGFIGVTGSTEKEDGLPVIKLYAQPSQSDWVFNILNSDLYHRARVLQYVNSSTQKITTGNYPYFSGSVHIEA